MKAFQYENSRDGLVLRDVPIPEPPSGSAQIRVHAAGICHSDCHFVQGHGDVLMTRRPVTLGHEVSGVITKLGPDVTDFAVGDRVAIMVPLQPPGLHHALEVVGIGIDGGFAEYAVTPVSRLTKVPEKISFALAAVATDALATSYHAVVQKAGAAPGVTIGIIGLGGLGMAGLRFAALKGATVYGIDVVESKFPEALGNGAAGCFKSISEASDVSFDVIVDFFGASETTAAALGAIKLGGKIVCVGLQSQTVTIPSGGMNGYISRMATIVGSQGSSIEDVKDVLDYLNQDAISPNLVEVPFKDIPATIDLLAKGISPGRYWSDPSKAS